MKNGNKNFLLILFCLAIIVFNMDNYCKNNYCFSENDVKNKQINEMTKYLNNFTFSNSFIYNDENVVNLLNFKFIYKNKIYNIIPDQDEKLTDLQKNNKNNNLKYKIKLLQFCINNGFNIEESVDYVFPEIKETFIMLQNEINKKYISPTIEVIKNTGDIKVKNAQYGIIIDKNKFYNDVFYKLTNKYDNNEIFITANQIDKKESVTNNNLRSSYSIGFGSSSEARKNNIIQALKALDGQVINPGEELSFNKTTGLRNEENGYKKAKVIKNGTFYQEYGGGVCQVSTVLYNAAILANLEIVEVNAHSLPIAYEKPCFDAMVNSGSSDLIIKNNTEKPVIIATSGINDTCLVNIYGIENEFNIVRKYTKLSDITDFEIIETDDFLKYGYEKPLEDNQKIVISSGKSGFIAEGELEYYKDGVLVKTKKIRKNIYQPTKRVVLVSNKVG